MKGQNPFETLLISPQLQERIPARQTTRSTELLSEIPGFHLGRKPPETGHRRLIPRQLGSLSNTLAQNIAVFPKSNRIVVNEHGVFIPRSLLGQNAEIRLEENRSADGSVRILVSSHQRDEKLKSYRRVEALDCSRELKWLTEHRTEYAGQWVALDGDRLLAHGKVAREVREKAHELGVELPLIVQVESPEDFPFGGW